MNATQREHPTATDSTRNVVGTGPEQVARWETRNMLCFVVYQVVVRVGWIFKTETVIMPAVLDAVADSGLLRGLLPVFNRSGQSLPPLVAAGPLGRSATQKWLLMGTTLLMAAWFALLAVVWAPLQARRPHVLAGVFLAVYGLFAASSGLNQLVAASLQGKLIAPARRGRLMVVSITIGSGVAILAAVLLLFPHYQAFARDRLGSQIGSLLTWVIAQNVATGVASLVAGPASDQRGTRIVLICLVALSSLTPMIVVLLSLLPDGKAAEFFWLVYLPLGLNPISLKIFTNYALELAPRPAEHPRYVSLVGAALAAPFILSPAVGMAVDGIGFRPVFVVGAAVIVAGAVLAGGLPEPRLGPETPR